MEKWYALLKIFREYKIFYQDMINNSCAKKYTPQTNVDHKMKDTINILKELTMSVWWE